MSSRDKMLKIINDRMNKIIRQKAMVRFRDLEYIKSKFLELFHPIDESAVQQVIEDVIKNHGRFHRVEPEIAADQITTALKEKGLI